MTKSAKKTKTALLLKINNKIDIKSIVVQLFPFFTLFKSIFTRTDRKGVLLYAIWDSKTPPSIDQLTPIRKILSDMLGDPSLQEKFAQSIIIFYEKFFNLELGELLIDLTQEGLYCTIDLKTFRIYIGSSTFLSRRIGTHNSNSVNWCTHNNNAELASIMRSAQDPSRFVTKAFLGKINCKYDNNNLAHRSYKEGTSFFQETLVFCNTEEEKMWVVREWEMCVIAHLSKFSCLSLEGDVKSLCFNQKHVDNPDTRKSSKDWYSPTQRLNQILEKQETLSLPLYTAWLEGVNLTAQQDKVNKEAQARLMRADRNRKNKEPRTKKSKELRDKKRTQLLEIKKILENGGASDSELKDNEKNLLQQHTRWLSKKRVIYKNKKYLLNPNSKINLDKDKDKDSLLIEQGIILTKRLRENLQLVLNENEELILQQCKKLKIDSRNKKSREWRARKKALLLEAKMQKDNGLPLTDNQKDVLQKHLSANTKRRASLNNSNNKKRNLLTASSDVNTETVVIVVASCYRRLGEGKGKEKGLLVQQGNLLKKRLTQDPGTVFNQEEQLIWEDFCLLREKKNKSQQERRDVSAEARQSINSSRRQKEKDARESKKAEILCIQNKQHKGEALSDSEKSSLQAYTDLKKKRSENRKKKC